MWKCIMCGLTWHLTDHLGAFVQSWSVNDWHDSVAAAADWSLVNGLHSLPLTPTVTVVRWSFCTTSRNTMQQRSCTLLRQLKFRQCFKAILYPSHRLTMQNFTEIVPGELLRRRLNAWGVTKYIDIGHVKSYISETVQDMASSTVND